MLGDNAPKTEFTFGIGWVDAACAQARKYRDGLNSLNAFPVPDKDTGSNLTVTLTALKEAFDAEYEVLQKEPKPADAAALNLRIGQLYERAIMQAYRSARGNSGSLLCTWALEAVRSYWGLPGHLTEDMDESEVAQIPVFSALHQQYEEAPAAEIRESSYREAFALSAAAQRVRQSVPDASLMRSTMGAVMLAVADYRFHYRPGSELQDMLNRSEYRRTSVLRALEGTAEYPPAPELKGTVDAGALGFYLTVVHTNSRWRTSRLDDAQIERMLVPPAMPSRHLQERRGDSTAASARVPEWELMGTVDADPVAVAQIRSELEQLGDSLLLTPLDVSAGMWSLHVHVFSLDDARAAIARHGMLREERVSSLREGPADSACAAD